VTRDDFLDVVLEIGARRVFAIAVDWPGWARSGREEQAALEALVAARGRYVRSLGRGFRVPDPGSIEDLSVLERVSGNATTDFGAPDAVLPGDADPISAEELERLERIVRACWRAFERTSQGAEGTTLTVGPRGGGRSLEAIERHLVEAEASYIRKLAAKPPTVQGDLMRASAGLIHASAVDALRTAVKEGVPERGPRGGKLWSPRRFVRRVTWHALDHAWEIEDRTANLSPG
jgi:hypothetical protein